MGTVHTLADSWKLINFWPVLELGNPFPRILWAIGEENVARSNLVTSVLIKRAFDCWQSCHVQLWEYELALAQEVCVINWSGSDSVQLGGSLEETELCTVLVCPLTTCIVNIYGCAEKWVVISNIITFRSIASLNLNIAHSFESLSVFHKS